MYCLYMVLHAGIIRLIIFLKPGLEPRLWAFSYGKPSPSPIQAHQWAGLGWAGLKRAGLGWALGFGPGPAHHYTCGKAYRLIPDWGSTNSNFKWPSAYPSNLAAIRSFIVLLT